MARRVAVRQNKHMSSQAGRGGMGMHKHGVSGHSGPNGRNLAQVAAAINAATDGRARMRRRLRGDGLAASIRELLGEPPVKRRRH